MMEHLFFNYKGSFSDVAIRIFKALGLPRYLKGDSLNVFGGTYASISMLGISIKLEENCYDYEDDYNYMLAVRKDPCASLRVDDATVNTFSRIVARLLADNVNIEVAIEADGGLELVYPITE